MIRPEDVAAVMLSVGCSAEQIVGALSALGKTSNAVSGAERTRKYRARRAEKMAAEGEPAAASVTNETNATSHNPVVTSQNEAEIHDSDPIPRARGLNPCFLEGKKEKEEEVREESSSLCSDSSFGATEEPADLFPGTRKIPRVKTDMRERHAEAVRFGEGWNAIAGPHGLPQIDLMDPGSAREKQAIGTIKWLSDNYQADYGQLLAKVRDSPYLLGKVKEFMATFDWIIAPRNRQRIWDGNYVDRQKNNGNGFAGGSFAYHQRR
jgi:hypothetical protein